MGIHLLCTQHDVLVFQVGQRPELTCDNHFRVVGHSVAVFFCCAPPLLVRTLLPTRFLGGNALGRPLRDA